jgi:hypothetical protein
VWCAVWLIGLAAAGCGTPPTVVTGTVTLDGQPLEKAIVQFRPERDHDRPAVGLTDALGHYRLAVSPALYRVVVLCQRVAGQRREGAGADAVLVDIIKDVVPEQYMRSETTPLRVEAQAGRTTVADFSLPGRK